MGIKFRCHSCQKKLHVKAFLAGKRGVCPHCGGKVEIPHESQNTSQPDSAKVQLKEPSIERVARKRKTTSKSGRSGKRVANGSPHAEPSVTDPFADAPQAVWYVRPPTGGQFGPADNEIMRRWLDEGRIGADSLVWREGWPDWKTAGPLFPSLAQPKKNEAATKILSDPPEQGAGEFNFATESPAAERPTPRPRRKTQQRNVTILVVLSIMCVALLVTLIFVLQRQS